MRIGEATPLYQSLAIDIAAVDGVLIGKRLVDLLHRTRRQARGEQAIAQRLGLVLGEHRRELLPQRLAIGDTILVARKARIGAELGLADFLSPACGRSRHCRRR